MARETRTITLSMADLRAIAGWAADCAERALPIYEAHPAADARPRAALEGARTFAGGGKRSAELRRLALAAFAAAHDAGHPAAAAAARAACLAASSAYTHPLADVEQTKHIVGPAAYAALALELAHPGEADIAAAELRRAIETAPAEARAVLLQMPARSPGKSRLDALMYAVDAGMREGSARGLMGGPAI